MYIREKLRRDKTILQIVASNRVGKKISQKIVRHVGQAVNSAELALLRKLAEKILYDLEHPHQSFLPGLEFESYSKKLYPECEDLVKVKNIREIFRKNDGFIDIFSHIYNRFGFKDILSTQKKEKYWNELLEYLVLARLYEPVSKLSTVKVLEKYFRYKTNEDKIYRLLDHLYEHEDIIKQAAYDSTRSLLQEKINVLFFDVTTLYFESFSVDELKNFGYSKDNKFKEVQVMLALVTTTSGLPVSYELFPGNTNEGSTLIKVVTNLKEKFLVERIVLVADRAMFTKDNLKTLEENHVEYIVAAKLRSFNKEWKTKLTEDEDYKVSLVSNELFWIKEYEKDGRRLVVSYSHKRAKKDFTDRDRLVQRLRKIASGKDLPVQKLIGNRGNSKYAKIIHGKVEINEIKIFQDQTWDGLHGLISNIKDDSTIDLIQRYKGLWQIEEAFRINKHDLKMRPIFHWTPNRIKAHISLAFLSYTILKLTMKVLEKENLKISINSLREELTGIESSLLEDKSNGSKYILPSTLNLVQKRIYNALGITRRESPIKVE